MAPVASYVFLDLETTGLPSQENNKTRITELCLVAVKREHLLDTRPGSTPRVQNKLTLCLNPLRLIQPSCTEVTGLCNDLLENETIFNMQVFETINNFLNFLQKPVCLIAQNGMNFDYPILKNHVEKLNISFSEDLLCADSFHGFYDILQERKQLEVQGGDNGKELSTETNEENCKQNERIEKSKTEIDQCDFMAQNTLPMKSINETTPKQQPKPVPTTPIKENRNKISKARRKFPWSEGTRPKEKYKLKDIYERLLNRPAVDAHRAENDCMLALECSVVLAKEFVKWVDENCVLFSEVTPMRLGVPLGH